MFGFAILQWNDPDRLQWISLYTATALLAILMYFKNCISCVKAWTIMLSMICVIMIVQAIPGVFDYIQTSNYSDIFSPMSDENTYVEVVREFIGLLIVLLYCIISGVLLFKKHRN